MKPNDNLRDVLGPIPYEGRVINQVRFDQYQLVLNTDQFELKCYVKAEFRRRGRLLWVAEADHRQRDLAGFQLAGLVGERIVACELSEEGLLVRLTSGDELMLKRTLGLESIEIISSDYLPLVI